MSTYIVSKFGELNGLELRLHFLRAEWDVKPCTVTHLSHLFIICKLIYVCVTVQKRAVRWPQDLDGEIRVVEFYVVNDYSQVSYGYAVRLNAVEHWAVFWGWINTRAYYEGFFLIHPSERTARDLILDDGHANKIVAKATVPCDVQ